MIDSANCPFIPCISGGRDTSSARGIRYVASGLWAVSSRRVIQVNLFDFQLLIRICLQKFYVTGLSMLRQRSSPPRAKAESNGQASNCKYLINISMSLSLALRHAHRFTLGR